MTTTRMQLFTVPLFHRPVHESRENFSRPLHRYAHNIVTSQFRKYRYASRDPPVNLHSNEHNSATTTFHSITTDLLALFCNHMCLYRPIIYRIWKQKGQRLSATFVPSVDPNRFPGYSFDGSSVLDTWFSN